MKCSNCGKETEYARYCKYCGQALDWEVLSPSWQKKGTTYKFREKRKTVLWMFIIMASMSGIALFILAPLMFSLVKDKLADDLPGYLILGCVAASLLGLLVIVFLLIYSLLNLRMLFKLPSDGIIEVDRSNFDSLQIKTTYNARTVLLRLKKPVYGYKEIVVANIFFGDDYEKQLEQIRHFFGKELPVVKKILTPMYLIHALKDLWEANKMYQNS